MTILYTDPIFLEHDTRAHPETAERLRAMEREFKNTGLLDRVTLGQFQPLDESQVNWIHDPEIAKQARAIAQTGGGMLDTDTVVSPASYRVALSAVGAGAAAVDAVITGSDRTAFCMVRPPGHHATPTRSMGFCLFNNIALAAERARREHAVDRLLIIDFDVHHGNGTQDIFYRDPNVYFLSVHRFGNGFYPGTGAANETGSGPGLGTTRNVPIRFGTSRDAFRTAFVSEIERAADACKPQLILVSAGFDAHRLDPIGGLGLEVDDYAVLTEAVLSIAQTHCGGRVVSCLEGGYHWTATAESAKAHLTTLVEKG